MYAIYIVQHNLHIGTKSLDTTSDPIRLGVEMKPVVSDFQLDELFSYYRGNLLKEGDLFGCATL
jgi:hypothetical protein